MIKGLSIKQRIQAGLVLTVAFLLVLGSNLLDRRYFTAIQETVKSIYKDRIVVQDYIYQLQDMAHEREVAFLKGEERNGLSGWHNEIKALLNDFSKTKLTRDEARLLKQLDDQFTALALLEAKNMEMDTNQMTRMKVPVQLTHIRDLLDGLEQIQLEQSGMLTQLSEKTLGVNRMLSNLEMVFLAIIGISILILTFYPVKILNPIHWN